MTRRIAIILHRETLRGDLQWYQIYYLAKIWREMGIDVDFVFGVDRFVPADVAILHIDLSVVPAEYCEFARRYPTTLNHDVVDIRKCTLSRNRVRAQDDYAGPVIVKSNLNNAGLPERAYAHRRLDRATLLHRWLDKGRQAFSPDVLRFNSAQDYRIYDNKSEVPQRYFETPDLIVERFLPEQAGELFSVRLYQFLGDRETCKRFISRHPIVSAVTCCGRESVEPHPQIVSLRHSLGFEYGKLDYVMVNGEPILLDANKTTGVGPSGVDAGAIDLLRYRAEGIRAYF